MSWLTSLFNPGETATAEEALEAMFYGTNVASGTVTEVAPGQYDVKVTGLHEVPLLPDGKEISMVDLIAEYGGQAWDV